MNKIKSALLIFFVLFGYCSFGQTQKTMVILETSYQACLDKGINMLGCSQVYYQQMDSMLNLVYKKVRKTMTPCQISRLKIEQLKWLANRDKYFKNIVLNTEERLLDEEDKEMVITDKKSDFVRERVVELIKINKE